DQVLDGLFEDDTGAKVSLQDRSRRLAGSKAGHPRPA
ncbi:MAG: hypothetical protein QOE66_38, partial [Chloroflexota bacterium]|nr:hypothetical protein [Chloroflexota bacterium]